MANMDEVAVQLTRTCFVQPASKSPQPWLFLPPCDTVMRKLPYNRRLLFYRHKTFRTSSHADSRELEEVGDDDEGYLSLVKTLESSLSQVLSYFYPLAGRLAVGPDKDGRLAVRCSDEGAEFVEAVIHGVSFDDLESSNFDMQPSFPLLTRWSSYNSLTDEGTAPLLSIQVTRFACGNIVLGIAHSHVLADGYSLWHFMSSWAECARGEPLSLLPSHDRTLLKLEHPSNLKAVFDLGETLEDPCQEGSNKENKKQRAFTFAKEAIERLKERANNNYGSYEVICAHVWKHVNKAHGHARDTKVGFTNVVNMRGRMEPPVPPSYFGNVLLWGMESTCVGTLEDEDLATTASRIRKGVNRCSGTRMRQLLHFMELYGFEGLYPIVKTSSVRIRVSSSPKFPTFECDFGWGRPLATRSVVVEENYKVIFYAGQQGLGSIDLCIALPCEVMERFENDPSLLNV